MTNTDKTIVYCGTLSVCGSGNLSIPCRGQPIEVEVNFSDPPPPKPGCGPVIEDSLDIQVEPQLKPFPLWAIKITWNVVSGNVREIAWKATVLLSPKK